MINIESVQQIIHIFSLEQNITGVACVWIVLFFVFSNWFQPLSYLVMSGLVAHRIVLGQFPAVIEQMLNA